MAGDGTKYRLQFLGSDGVDNIIDIIIDGYDGEVITVVAAAPPVELNYLGDVDDNQPVVGSECKVNMYNETDEQYMEIFNGTCRRHRMRWKRDMATFWTGWVDPDFMAEQYISTPFVTTIHATCGLGELKDIDFVIPVSPEVFNKSIISILQTILANTGLELPIWVVCDYTFRTQGGINIDARVLEHMTVDWRVFRRDDNTFMNCYDILDTLLGDLRMRIYQCAGHWQIENVQHKYAAVTVDKYTWTGVYSMSFDVDANVLLTALMVDDMVRANSSATRTISPAFKRFTMNQNYGIKDTFLAAYNLDGIFWDDEWLDDYNLKFWSRATMLNIYRDMENSVRLGGFVDHLPWAEYLQCQTVVISGHDAIENLMETWGKYGGIRMMLTFEYFVRADQFNDAVDGMTLWLQMCVRDTDDVILYGTNGWPEFPNDLWPDNVYWEFEADRMIKLDKVIPNRWNKVELTMAPPKQRTWNVVGDEHNYWLKFFPPQTTVAPDQWKSTDGLMIKNVKWGWVDQSGNGTRSLDETVDEYNRLVPSPYEFKFGETPGVWGLRPREHGQQYMHRYNLYDTTGMTINEFSMVGSLTTGTMGGLINACHRLMIRTWHGVPRFVMNAEIWDLSGAIGMDSVLNDYSGNKYVPGRLTFLPDQATWNGEWLQIPVPKTTGADGGGFSWGFSNGFDI